MRHFKKISKDMAQIIIMKRRERKKEKKNYEDILKF
jgi:hypothetical protein